jgi:hypothetical protein
MKRVGWLLAAALVCCALLGPAQAQMWMHTPYLSGVFHPVVGAGAVYSVVETQGDAFRRSTFEMAVVGQEQVNGKDGYWLEMGFDDPQSGGKLYMKTLAVVDGQYLTTSRAILQMAGGQPVELSTSMMGEHGNKPSVDIRSSAERVGADTKSITTPAGTFECVHWRLKDDSDYWISDKVVPWSLVKMVAKNKTIILLRTVTDAKTHIAGTPAKSGPM